METTKEKKVWFVTGASRGLGLSIVKQLLAAGQQVAATSRNPEELAKAVNADSEDFLPLQLNLTDDNDVAGAVKKAIEAFGKIDVIINNAGYGIGGSVEELSDAETRSNLDINLFGTINVIRHALPYMRSRQSGHIINISSIAGIAPGSGWAIYSAAKAAVVGLSESLAEDVRPFGIKVTVVAPGAFRTSFLSEDSLVLTSAPVAAYENLRAVHKKYVKLNGQQAGDPEKAAAHIIGTAFQPQPPLHLLLGGDAYNRALNKIEAFSNEVHALQDITCSTDY